MDPTNNKLVPCPQCFFSPCVCEKNQGPDYGDGPWAEGWSERSGDSQKIEVDIDCPITSKAAEIWGMDGQLAILQEECAEVITSISRFNRGRVSSLAIAEEIGDVLVCCQSVVKILNIKDDVVDNMAFKVTRLGERIEKQRSLTLDERLDEIYSGSVKVIEEVIKSTSVELAWMHSSQFYMRIGMNNMKSELDKIRD